MDNPVNYPEASESVSEAMDDSQLVSILEHEERNSFGELTGDLSDQRAKAMEYYLGRPFGDELEGRSQLVSSDVYDAVEGALPSLLEIFTSSDRAVEFTPTGIEDDAGARQATQACNYVFYKQNNGFLVLYTWFKDALIQKNGFVKFYYENTEQRKKEKYRGISDTQLAMLVNDPSVTLTAKTSYPDPTIRPQMGMQPMLHDVEITVKSTYGKVCVENIPPEEFLVSKNHKSILLQDCPFCEHVRLMSLSELKEMGYDVSEDELSYDDDPQFAHPEAIARKLVTNDHLFPGEESMDPAQRKGIVREAYIRVDYDGDGIAELRKVLRVGKNRILSNEEIDYIPFASLTPNIMPHEFFGLGFYDSAADIQYYKSSILRTMMDGLYSTIMPRLKVLSTPSGVPQANLDDLLTARPGGVIREYVPNAVNQLDQRFVGQQAFPMVEYWDAAKENRIGITRYNQGLEADSLNKTAHGISAIMNAGQQKQRLIARIFAETGVKELFKGILHCLSTYSTKPMIMRLTNGFVEVDPRQWSTQWDISVNVGLGTGDRQAQLQHLGAIATMQDRLLKMGKTHMISDENLYHHAAEVVENSGLKHVETYFTDPKKVKAPQPRPNPDLVKLEVESKLEQGKIQAKSVSDERNRQAEIHKESIRADVEKFTAQLRSQTDVFVKKMEIEATERVEQMKARANAEMAIFDANSKALMEPSKPSAIVKVGDDALKEAGVAMKESATAMKETAQAIIAASHKKGKRTGKIGGKPFTIEDA